MCEKACGKTHIMHDYGKIIRKILRKEIENGNGRLCLQRKNKTTAKHGSPGQKRAYAVRLCGAHRQIKRSVKVTASCVDFNPVDK